MPRRAFAVAVCLIAAMVMAAPARSQSPPPSPETLAAAKELVVTMRAADQLRTLFPMIMQQLKPAIAQGRPEVEKDYDATMPQLVAAANARVSEFVDAIATVYAAHFTAAELRQIGDFYKGPVGQKFLENMPKIMQDSMSVGQKFGASLAEDMRNRMSDELRKKGHKL
jgi:uncharacterized protein